MIEFSTDKAVMQFSDGILLLRINEDAHMEISDFQEVFDLRDKNIGNKKYAVLLDAKNFHSSEKDVRDFLANYNPPNQVGVAIVSKLLPIRLLANFYMNINKPLSPTKLVKTEKEGINWLKSLGSFKQMQA